MDQMRMIYRNGDSMTISRKCKVTGKEYSVTFKVADYDEWALLRSAQDAFPYLNADQWKFLMTDTTPAEWNAMLPAGTDEE